MCGIRRHRLPKYSVSGTVDDPLNMLTMAETYKNIYGRWSVKDRQMKIGMQPDFKEQKSRLEEAIPLRREHLEGCIAILGAQHEDTLQSARSLIDMLEESGAGGVEEAAALRGKHSL